RRARRLPRRHGAPPPPARDGGAAAPRRAPRAAQAPGRSRALRCDRRGGRAARRAVRLGRILVAGAIFAGVVALTFPTDALVRWALTRALPPGGPRLEFDHARMPTLKLGGERLEGTTAGAATLKGAAGEGTLEVHRMTWPSAARFLVGAEAIPIDATVWWTLAGGRLALDAITGHGAGVEAKG